MSVSCQFSVATHLLVALAWNPGALLSSEKLGQTVATNPVVVRRILSKLVAAGMVNSVQGKHGGFQLREDPARIALDDVHQAVEGHAGFVIHDHPTYPACPVSVHIKDVLHTTLTEVTAAVRDRLRQSTIADLTAIVRQRSAEAAASRAG